MAEDQNDTFVQFTLFGQSFKLRCDATQKEKLEKAAATIEAKGAQLMQNNPSLTPIQVAILVALDLESTKTDKITLTSPFEKQAYKLIHNMKDNLNKCK